MLTPQEKEVVKKAIEKGFPYFVENIGKYSIENFVGGKHVIETARFLSSSKRTMRISFRTSMKSLSFYLYVMWKILTESPHRNYEIHYFSFKEDMAGYHIKKIKEMIKKNPFYRDLIDLKPLSEVVGAWTWDKKHITRIYPHGVTSFTRGIHGDLLLCDDLLSDPENPLNPSIIKKINEIFASVILQSVKPGGEIHIVGTALTRGDFYYDPDIRRGFKFAEWPAIIDEGLETERSRWPEFISLEELKKIRKQIGPKRFAREYQTSPFYSEEAFFSKPYLRKYAVNPNLINLDPMKPYETSNTVIAGFDIGRKAHYSHLSVFELKNRKWVMIHHRFLVSQSNSAWPYYIEGEFTPFRPSQIPYLIMCIKNFKIDKLFYDNTRGEFEGFVDQGLLPPQMIPVNISHKRKIQMASDLDRMILNKEIELINDEKLLNSISSVTNDLKAIATEEGHGDAFSSICLATLGFKQYLPSSSTLERFKIKAGGKSLFEPGSPIPKGW